MRIGTTLGSLPRSTKARVRINALIEQTTVELMPAIVQNSREEALSYELHSNKDVRNVAAPTASAAPVPNCNDRSGQLLGGAPKH